MTKSRFFVFGVVSFAVGVLLQSRFSFSSNWLLITLGIVVVFLAVLNSLKASKAVFVASCALLMVCGALRMQLAVDQNQFQKIVGTKQQFDALIVSDVDVRPDRQMLTVRARNFTQNILITTTRGQLYHYGDRLLISGKLTLPKPGEDFDYQAYLERFNTYALLSYPKIIILQTGQGHFWVRWLLKVKYAFIRQASVSLPEVESNLLLGILIGARKGLPDDVIDNFNKTGVSHVIAISGYNISIIVSALGFLNLRLGRKLNFWFTLLVILAFVIISGASASVVRAAFMGTLVLLAQRTGRLYTITPSLCAAALIMLMVNPRILYWDAGFQLSFLATAGVVYLAPVLESLTESWSSLFGIKLILITTFSAIIATLPLILFQFGRLSLVAPIVNILILPLVPTAMLCGFLTGLPGVGYGFGIFSHWLLKYMLTVTERFAHLHYSSVEVHISSVWLWFGYAFIIASYVVLKRFSKSLQNRFPVIQ